MACNPRAALLAVCCLLASARLASGCFETVDFAALRSGRSLHAAAQSAGAAWTYNANGADWPGTCASGKEQSPIAIAGKHNPFFCNFSGHSFGWPAGGANCGVRTPCRDGGGA